MKIELGLDVLRSYKRMAYEPWTALGEFVDNSTQSYFNNKEVLDKALAAEGTNLEVSIVYEKEDSGVLRISDNAMGMNRDEARTCNACGLAARLCRRSVAVRPWHEAGRLLVRKQLENCNQEARRDD